MDVKEMSDDKLLITRKTLTRTLKLYESKSGGYYVNEAENGKENTVAIFKSNEYFLAQSWINIA